MTVTDPAPFLREIDVDFLKRYKSIPNGASQSMMYSEPRVPVDSVTQQRAPVPPTKDETASIESQQQPGIVQSKVITLGDFIDTDALSPGFTLTSCTTEAEFGQYVLCHTHPEFRQQVKRGHQVVVGGHAFGVGSSRESAVSALKGAGVQAVIAKSFAFIFGRNLPSLGLLGIVMGDGEFYSAAKDGATISIDLQRRTIVVAETEFAFRLSEIEYRLTMDKGISQAYAKYGKAMWERLMQNVDGQIQARVSDYKTSTVDRRLEW